MGWVDHRGPSGFGDLLQQARAYKGSSLREAERVTRIPRRHLSALEHEEFHQLPPLIYARGIVRNYAQYLGLDPVETLAQFERSHGQRSGGFRVVPAVKTVDVPSHWAPNFAIIAFMVVMSAVIFAWMYSAYFAPTDSTPTEQTTTAANDNDEQDVATMDDDTDVDTSSRLFEGGGERFAEDDADDADASNGDDGEANAAGTAEQEDEPASPEPDFHTFAVTTIQSVWVQATVDGEIVFEGVVDPGETVTFEGDSLTLASGNAPLVNVMVDGEDRGTLGDEWDEVNTFP